MKKQRIVKIIVVLALALVNAVSIAFGIYEYKNGGKVEIASIAKMAAIFGASVITCIKVLVRTNVKRSPSLYRESYKEYVEKAFITDRKKEKLLFFGS